MSRGLIPARVVREVLTEKATRLLALSGVLVAFGLWCVVSYGGLIRTDFLPSPTEVLSAMLYLHLNEALVRGALASLMRVFLGFGASLVIAFPLGVLAGSLPRLRSLVFPVVEPFRILPIAGILPITILWFGIGEAQKVAALVLGTVFFLVVAVSSAIESVDPTYDDLALTLGATAWQRIRKVLLPAASPAIWEACRNLFGVTFGYILLAEALNAKYGLGAITIAAQRRQHVDQVFAVIIVILVLGYGCDFAIKYVGRRLFRWAPMP